MFHSSKKDVIKTEATIESKANNNDNNSHNGISIGRFGVGVKASLLYAMSTRPHTSGHLHVETTYVVFVFDLDIYQLRKCID
jgi:hypothetical protein